ncbi:MAG TPA: cupin domain-containing protein, partial [Acidimicrobiales bacterium]|nr:cupin domain-containing protein [Acidimicrobiales bacterium]
MRAHPVSTVQEHFTERAEPNLGADVATLGGDGAGLDGLGARIREARAARRISVRQLARLVDCSASMISQIERGRAHPSVGTLYDISIALQISLDGLFSDNRCVRSQPRQAKPEEPSAALDAVATGLVDRVVAADAAGDLRSSRQPDPRAADSENPAILRKRNRRTLYLAHGVRWELLMPVPERSAEFMEVYYPPGGGSVEKGHAIRHNGREYGVIVEGMLSVQLGFEEYELEPGDSMAFDSAIPHRYWNATTEPVRG